MNRAVRYDRFNGIDELYLADLPDPIPGDDEVVIEPEAGSLNPGALSALDGALFIPNRDLSGTVVAVGAGTTDFAIGDAVLGWVQSWDAHAQQVAVPVSQLVMKPPALSWDVAGCLYTTPMAGVGAVKAVGATEGDLLVISGASGGVGGIAAQYALRAGARVLGLTSQRHHGLLEELGITPVLYGDGEMARIREAAADQPPSAFIDAVGVTTSTSRCDSTSPPTASIPS